MPGLAPDVPDRITGSHREASAPSSPPHEADKVGLEVQLGGAGGGGGGGGGGGVFQDH